MIDLTRLLANEAVADSLLLYAADRGPRPAEMVRLDDGTTVNLSAEGIDPDRFRGFLARVMDRHGVEFVEASTSNRKASSTLPANGPRRLTPEQQRYADDLVARGVLSPRLARFAAGNRVGTGRVTLSASRPPQA